MALIRAVFRMEKGRTIKVSSTVKSNTVLLTLYKVVEIYSLTKEQCYFTYSELPRNDNLLNNFYFDWAT